MWALADKESVSVSLLLVVNPHLQIQTHPQPTHLHASFLDKLVDIISRTCGVWQIIMGHKINLQTNTTSSTSHCSEKPHTKLWTDMVVLTNLSPSLHLLASFLLLFVPSGVATILILIILLNNICHLCVSVLPAISYQTVGIGSATHAII